MHIIFASRARGRVGDFCAYIYASRAERVNGSLLALVTATDKCPHVIRSGRDPQKFSGEQARR